MTQAIRIEWWKFRASRVPLVASILMVVGIPLMALGFFGAARGEGLGLLSQKSSVMLTGEGWAGYLDAATQIAAVALLLGAGIVAAWCFGREYADRIFPSLCGRAISRATIAGAKSLVLGGWALLVSLAISAFAAGVGAAAGVGGGDPHSFWHPLATLFVVSATATGLGLTLALPASIGQGHLPAIGVLIVIVAIAQIAVLFGLGGWFPYSVPGLIAVAGSSGSATVGAVQILLLPVEIAAALGATIRWWQTAEVA